MASDERSEGLVLMHELHVSVYCLAEVEDIEAARIRDVTTVGLRRWATDATQKAAGRFTVSVDQ